MKSNFIQISLFILTAMIATSCGEDFTGDFAGTAAVNDTCVPGVTGNYQTNVRAVVSDGDVDVNITSLTKTGTNSPAFVFNQGQIVNVPVTAHFTNETAFYVQNQTFADRDPNVYTVSVAGSLTTDRSIMNGFVYQFNGVDSSNRGCSVIVSAPQLNLVK